jgi:hypothetical protein
MRVSSASHCGELITAGTIRPNGTKPPSAGTRASRSTCCSGCQARRGRAQGNRGSAEDRRDLERAAGWGTCALVLPDAWRRHRGRATVAIVLLPGVRAMGFRRPTHARPSRALRFRASSLRCRVGGAARMPRSPSSKCCQPSGVMHLWSVAVIYAWLEQRTAHILREEPYDPILRARSYRRHRTFQQHQLCAR